MKYNLASWALTFCTVVLSSTSARAQETVNQCIHYHRGTQGADISVFTNSCPFSVNVLFWSSGKNLGAPGVCTGTKLPMCGDTVPAGGRETEFSYTGTVHLAACRYPATPQSNDGVTFSCIGGASDLWANHKTYEALADRRRSPKVSDSSASCQAATESAKQALAKCWARLDTPPYPSSMCEGFQLVAKCSTEAASIAKGCPTTTSLVDDSCAHAERGARSICSDPEAAEGLCPIPSHRSLPPCDSHTSGDCGSPLFSLPDR